MENVEKEGQKWGRSTKEGEGDKDENMEIAEEVFNFQLPVIIT